MDLTDYCKMIMMIKICIYIYIYMVQYIYGSIYIYIEPCFLTEKEQSEKICINKYEN